MTNESQAIDVEVVEVDGITPPARFEPREEKPQRPPWQQWQGRVRTLDSRWWPLWVFLGVITVALLLTFGVVIGLIFVILRIIKGILKTIFG